MYPRTGRGAYSGQRGSYPNIRYVPGPPHTSFYSPHHPFSHDWNYGMVSHYHTNRIPPPHYFNVNPAFGPFVPHTRWSHASRGPSPRLQDQRPGFFTHSSIPPRQSSVRAFLPTGTAPIRQKHRVTKIRPFKATVSVSSAEEPKESIVVESTRSPTVTQIVTPLLSAESTDYNLREKLIHQLRRGSYQCVICISEVQRSDPIWSCSTCFHIYHLLCIKSWAVKCSAASNSEGSATEVMKAVWRCPACQTKQETASEAIVYSCFCGRVREPEYCPGRTSIPHGCDEVCGKSRSKVSVDLDDPYSSQMVCTHPCTELCHPGPCPPCMSSVSMHCPCGHMQRSSLCGSKPPGPCGRLCGRKLSTSQAGSIGCAIGVHDCLFACHLGDCPPCPWVIETSCFCGREKRNIVCGSTDANKIMFTSELLNLLAQTLDEFRSSMVVERSVALELEQSLTLNQGEEAGSTEVLDPTTPTSKAPDYDDVNSAADESTISPVLLCTPPVVSVTSSFSCGRLCERTLSCGNHKCSEPCHAGPCKSCALDPSRCFTCPCGLVPLSKLVSSGDPAGDRSSCSDAVPCCPNICARPHPLCGHPCPVTCHPGPCPPCELSITAKCRCGRATKKLTCFRFEECAQSEGLVQMTCERICNKKKTCGRHKCRRKCCDLSLHPCSEVCGRRLTCQQHNCEEPCHPGPCGTCWRGVIFTELYCRCGYTVLHPPQPCGSSGPECSQPCSLPHECDHPVRHTCHQDPTCPPCTVLMAKECPGGHGVQFSMPCFQPVLGCGRVCGKPLRKCSHKCQRLCHVGDCLDPNAAGDENNRISVCTQPCQKPRPECGHPCSLPCHEASSLTCSQAVAHSKGLKLSRSNEVDVSLPPCQKMVSLVCACGRRKDSRPCHQVQVRERILALQEEASRLFVRIGQQPEPLQILACDAACATAAAQSAEQPIEMTLWRRGFDTVEGAGKDGTECNLKTPFELPEYSEFLRTYATKNFSFAQSIEQQLYSMVLQFWKPPNKPDGDPVRVLNHHFPPMNKKRRRFVRELAEVYGMESYTFDADPNRHVMVLAKRGYTRFPGGASDNRGGLLSCLKREGVIQPTKKPDPKVAVLSQSVVRSSYASVLKQNNPH